MPKKKIIRRVVADPTANLKNKRILESRRTKIRQFLVSQSVKTGRDIADLISQALTKDEIARALQLMLERVHPNNDSGSIFPPSEVEVKDEPLDETLPKATEVSNDP